jgi:hypothetical protein
VRHVDRSGAFCVKCEARHVRFKYGWLIQLRDQRALAEVGPAVDSVDDDVVFAQAETLDVVRKKSDSFQRIKLRDCAVIEGIDS